MNAILSKYVINILGGLIQTTRAHHPRLPFQNIDSISFNHTSPMGASMLPSTQYVLTKHLL